MLPRKNARLVHIIIIILPSSFHSHLVLAPILLLLIMSCLHSTFLLTLQFLTAFFAIIHVNERCGRCCNILCDWKKCFVYTVVLKKGLITQTITTTCVHPFIAQKSLIETEMCYGKKRLFHILPLLLLLLQSLLLLCIRMHIYACKLLY